MQEPRSPPWPVDAAHSWAYGDNRERLLNPQGVRYHQCQARFAGQRYNQGQIGARNLVVGPMLRIT